jgi:hypothetical protein
MRQSGRVEEIPEQAGQPSADETAGKVRNLTLEDVPPVAPLVGALTIGSSGLNLRPGRYGHFYAHETKGRDGEGWVEVERMADEMEDSIMVSGT